MHDKISILGPQIPIFLFYFIEAFVLILQPDIQSGTNIVSML